MKPNILFFVFDSLRADKFYGKFKTAKTPNFDKLMENGVYFEQAIASADATVLALNSIFNATFPFATGVRTWKIILTENNFLDFLKKSGYNMYGLMPDLTMFSKISDCFVNDDKFYQAIAPFSVHPFISNAKTIIKNISTNNLTKPWFYYLHSEEFHWPLDSPEDFDNEKYGDNRYDRMLALVDHWLGKIFEEIDMKNTIIIITSDHGQHIPFDEKGMRFFEPEFKKEIEVGKKIMPKFTHKIGAKMIVKVRDGITKKRLKKANEGLTPFQKRSRLPHTSLSVFDETVRVPLLISGFNLDPKIIPDQVRSIDIFPTIIDLLGFKRRHKFHGRSLVPFFRNESLEELPVYMHTNPHIKITTDDKVGIRTSKYKYFRGVNPGENVNLYDLKNDPQENYNIASNNPEIVEEMENILENLSSETQKDDYEEEISQEEMKRMESELKELGYLDEDENLTSDDMNSNK